MAYNKPIKPTKAQEEQSTTPAEETNKDTMYSKAVLITNASQLGTTPELMAGALTAVKSDSLTKQEANYALKAYLTRPVNPKKGSEK